MKKIIFLSVIVALSSSTQVKAQEKALSKQSSDILTSWMDLHCKLVRKANGVSHVAYSRHFAYTAIAAYESIAESEPSYRTLAGQLTGLSGLPAISKSQLYPQASLNAAYAEMLRRFYGAFGSCNATVDSMENAQKQFLLKEGVALPKVEKSVQYGKAVASSILQWADKDGSDSKKEYTALTGEGIWTPTAKAAAPFWSENRSMTGNLLSQFSLKQPVYSIDTSSDFYKMVNEVYTVSVHLTPDQKATALYWDDSPNGKYISAFGHWTSILSGVIKQNRLTLIKAAAAYAKMTIAMHEATILAWKGKYQFNVLRPASYIQQHINKEWTPLIATPPHPEFPAAHATISNAASAALISVFGEKFPVSDNSYTDIGMKQRNYASFREAAREAGFSRLYGGIHYRYSIEQGFSLGESAVKYIDKVIKFH